MEHFIIQNTAGVKFTSGRYQKYDGLFIKTVHAMSHIAERFFEDEFLKFTVNGISVCCFRTVKNENFIIVCGDGTENKIYEKVYKMYTRAVLFDDMDLLRTMLKEVML